MMAVKARRFLQGGTQLVWVVWPQSQHIDVWRAGIVTGPDVILGMSDTLNGKDIVRGFSHPVAHLFVDPLA